MAQHDLKPGDLVKLKSGGPKMTFGSFVNDACAQCYWFVGASQKTAVFPLAALQPFEA